MTKSIAEVRREFLENGKSISGWARDNGFSKDLVYRILGGTKIPVRGESHRIAVELGLKKGSISNE